MRAINKIALITGAPGQAAWFLTKLLLESKNYKEIYITYRYSSTSFDRRFEGWEDFLANPRLKPLCLDITDISGISKTVQEIKPNEIYNAAAASHVGESFKNPLYVFDVNTKSVIGFLEAIRLHNPKTKFLQFSTSEQFGSQYIKKWGKKVQNLDVKFEANSPYAASKIAAYNMVKLYREAYGLFCVNTVLFNYESHRRGENFLTRKVTKWIGQTLIPFLERTSGPINFTLTKIIRGDSSIDKLKLGNLDAVRDWSHCSDIIKGVFLAMQYKAPEDFVFCSGEGHSVRDFVKTAFSCVNIDNYEHYIYIDENLIRPREVEFLQGDFSKAKKILRWSPAINFNELVNQMIKHDKGSI